MAHKKSDKGDLLYRLWIWYGDSSSPIFKIVTRVFWGPENNVPDGFLEVVDEKGNITYLSLKNVSQFRITNEEGE